MAEATRPTPLAATASRPPAVMPDAMLQRIKHASEEVDATTESFLLIGRKSSGKKSLALTIPGKKFIHCFDQNASSGLAGRNDIDYAEWLPKRLKTTIRSTPLGGVKGVSPVADPPGPWGDFEKFHMLAQETDFYQQYDVIGFISCTSMLSVTLDHVCAMEGRSGYVPQLSDYNVAGQAIANIFRSALSEDVIVFATAHYSYEQDDETKKMMNIPVLVGQQKSKIPNIFSNAWMLEIAHDRNKGEVKYFVQTAEDRESLNLGRSRRLAFLKPRFEVTVDDPNKATGWGIDTIFTQAGIKLKERKAQSD